MLTRIITALVGIPFVILVVLLGNPALKYTMMIISCIGLYEFYRVIKSKYRPMSPIGYGAIVIYFLALNYCTVYYIVYVAALLIITLTWMVIKYPKYSIVDVALTVFSPLYIGLLFSFIVLISDMTYGAFWIWLIMFSSWGSDTFAYFTGVFFGKHKLAPLLSPKKTIEGSIGGIVGAGLLAYIYTIIYTQYAFQQLRGEVWLIVIVVIIAAAVSQIGDLAASSIKRIFNEKDFGYILPGHGGVLDRFDSFLLVAPVIYMAASLVEQMIR